MRICYYIKRIIAFFVCFGMILGLLGCNQLEDSGISYIDAATDVSTLSEATIDKIVENIVGSMSLNEKVGQLFIVDIASLEPSRKSVNKKRLSGKLKKNMGLYPIGGVVLYSNDIKKPEQLKRLINNMQSQSEINLFVCVDEEGGTVSRIAANKKMGVKELPSMQEIGATMDSKQANEVGLKLGAQLKKFGINVDFAPVADVLASEEPESSAVAELNSRAFGHDSAMVADMVSEEVKGLIEGGVMATLKHFPGQGAATSDTHISAANVTKSIEELRQQDFIPFKKGIKAGAQFVMLSHESLSSLTGDSTPVCMSSLVVTDILQEELGFKGIVITDAMNMVPIVSKYTSSEAAVNCIKAGVDMVLMPEDLMQAYDGVINSVRNGILTEDSIDESVRKIIKCKVQQEILPLDSELVVKASQESYEKIGEMENDN